MALRRVVEGKFVCESCEERYVAEDVPEEELLCKSCGGKLVEEEDEEDSEDEDEEDEEDEVDEKEPE